tara:strand:+ start:245 stop:1318 length:1074 start_codon:yes stop_codon:yes gene_type:complete
MSKASDLANLIGNINAGGGGVNRNLVINGAMNVAQRGTSQAFAHDGTTNAFLIDRWRFVINLTDELDGTYAQVADDPFGGSGNALKWTTGTAESAIASGEYGYFTQKIEAQNIQHIQNGNSNAKSLTLSFYVKSSITGTFAVGLYKPDNTARIFNKTYTIDSANTWEKKSVTFAGDTSGGGIDDDNGEGFWVNWHLFAGSDYKGGGSTSGWTDYANTKWADGQATDAVATTAGATWLMTQCQLEVGQNPTEFEHEPHERTEMKCYRYFYQSSTYPLSLANAHTTGYSFRQERTQQIGFPVIMRNSPTITAVQSASNYSSTLTFQAARDFVVVKPDGHAGDIPSAEYWYGGYKADAEL